MALTICAKCKREWQANSGVELCPWCRAETAESSLAAMRQRAEEAEARAVSLLDRVRGVRDIKDRVEANRDAALARAERAEGALREYTHFEASLIADRGSWSGATGHPFRTDRLLDQFMERQRLRNAALSSPPADASKMGGERERQYMEALAAYANDEDRYNRGEGEPYGSIPVEVGAIARQARAALSGMEQKS